MKSKIQRITVQYEGRVQGVGFRFTVMDIVRDFSVTGFVKNCRDGSVELAAEGTEEELMGLINAIRSSVLSRGIRNEQMHRSPATGEFRSFSVRR